VDGELTCGSGRADPIAPSAAKTRLLPSILPRGWSLTKVFARSTTTTGYCVTPSLVALQTRDDGLITGKLSVLGPVRANMDDGMGGSAPDTVNGRAARRFDADNGGGPVYRWLWSDDQGRQWQAEVAGYSLAQARVALAAVTIDGTQVEWDTAQAPAALKVVHHRTGDPYSTTSRGLDWYVRFSDGIHDRAIEIRHDAGAGSDTERPLAEYATVGARRLTVDGLPALLFPTVTGDDGDADGQVDPPSTPLLVQITPGTLAWTWAMGDLPVVKELVASLTDVPRSDSRLARQG
jgi:hypothetical protein